MKEIIQWLREIEHNASTMYHQAATIYANDAILREFLEHNEEDEAWHYHVMGSAAEFLLSEPEIIPVISIDEKTNEKILKQIFDIISRLEQKNIKRDELIEKIVELELSEWNDIFLYAVNLLKEKTSEFKYPAARIQAHLKHIEYFIEIVEARPDVLKKIKQLEPVWIENILIVDDEELITSLMKALLYRSGSIDVAHNGREALNLMEKKYYKLIISDFDMPVMDGIAFYKGAVEKYPDVHKRFLFMTGNLTPEREIFINENRVTYLEKPMAISLLREAAAKIIIA